MSSDTESILAGVDMAQLVQSYGIELQKKGDDYVGLCAFHEESTPSMFVYQSDGDKGRIYCYGCLAQEDAAGFVMKKDNIDFKQAMEVLKTKVIRHIEPSPEPKPAPAKWVSEKPPIGSMPDMTTKIGSPAVYWTYMDGDGATLGFIARYETEQGKTYRPWTYGRMSQNQPLGWAQKTFSAPRPLYGLDRLTEKPAAQVIIVEGEKAADAGQELLPSMVVISWPGGASAEKTLDLAPLTGRKIILIPDADIPGQQSMQRLAKLLVPVASKVGVVDSSDQPSGWDLADAEWTSAETVAWIKKNLLRATLTETQQKPTMKLVDKPELDTVEVIEETIDGNVVSLASKRLELNPEVPPEFSESALAQAWSQSTGRDWRYTYQWGRWHYWDESRWRHDETNSVLNRCQQKLINLSGSATAIANLSVQARRALCSKSIISNVLSLAGSDDVHAMRPGDWDADIWALPTPGGTLNLKTGLIREPSRNDNATKVTAVTPDLTSTEADCPNWISLLERATRKDKGMIEYLQRWCGYMLTGDTREECFMFVYGPGGSGKSTFVRNLSAVLGDYATASRMEAFMEQKNPGHSTEIAKLAGARLVTATETNQGGRWNEARIKVLTGRDKIAARFMRKDEFEFLPQFKLLIAGNHRPALRSVGEEMRRRLHVVDFPDSIPEDEKIFDMDDRLKSEYPAILAWAVRGCLEWQKQGLATPQKVHTATREYLESEDTLGAWLDECCEIDDRYHTQTSEAYKSYSNYIQASGEGVFSQKRFTQMLEERGFFRDKVASKRVIRRIMIKVIETARYNNEY